jgi:thioredoxin-like negative regulator of GroEL
MLIPVLENLAADYEDKIILAKVNVEWPENQAIAMDHWVSSIPHVFLYKNGEQVDQFIGAMPMDNIKVIVDKHF